MSKTRYGLISGFRSRKEIPFVYAATASRVRVLKRRSARSAAETWADQAGPVGSRSMIVTRRFESGKGNGVSSTAFTTVNTVEIAAMVSAIVRNAMKVN